MAALLPSILELQKGSPNIKISWKILEVPPFTICTYLYTASKPRNFNGFAERRSKISLKNPLVFVVVVVVVTNSPPPGNVTVLAFTEVLLLYPCLGAETLEMRGSKRPCIESSPIPSMGLVYLPIYLYTCSLFMVNVG